MAAIALKNYAYHCIDTHYSSPSCAFKYAISGQDLAQKGGGGTSKKG